MQEYTVRQKPLHECSLDELAQESASGQFMVKWMWAYDKAKLTAIEAEMTKRQQVGFV